MFRIWIKIVTSNHLVKDMTITDKSTLNRTKKIFNAVELACYTYDLSKPIWLDKNISEFKRLSRTRFYADNFIDQIDFDFLEIQVLEED